MENFELDFVEIAKILEANKGNKPQKQEELEVCWKPIENPDAITPDFLIPETRKKASQKEQLSKVLTFIYSIHKRRFRDKVTIMPIASTSKAMIQICGSQQAASDLIKYMKTLGLISVYDDNCRFGKIKKCIIYNYFYQNEVLLKKYCKENDINKFDLLNYDFKLPRRRITSFDAKQVKFESHCNFLKPDNYSKPDFERYLTLQLYENYPILKALQIKADTINYKYLGDNIDMHIRFIPKFEWKGNVVKSISVRATNKLCQSKRSENRKTPCDG